MPERTNRIDAPAGIRRAAVLTVFAFGCTTVRVPASTMAPTVPVHEGVAEPQLELWLESGQPVSPEESARATAEARAALGSALARVSAPRGDSILVVRAQGVARTPSRRSEQRAAVAGLVVGAVVVVAAVVAVAVATKGKGLDVKGKGSGPVARGPRVRPLPAARPSRVAHVAPRFPVAFDVFAGIQVPPPGAEGTVQEEPAYDGQSQGWDVQPPPPLPSQDLAEVALPPPSPFPLKDRGFFAGDALRLELVVVDRRDGTPLWVKVVEGKTDPRDARAVQKMLERALYDQAGWVPASG